MSAELSHIDETGRASMVNVTGKAVTKRHAFARCVVKQVPNTVASLGGRTSLEERGIEGRAELSERAGSNDGESTELGAGVRLGRAPLEEALVAGLTAAKQTSILIPLCHPLLLDELGVEFFLGEDSIEVIAHAATFGQTGVEMEALTACAIAAVSLFGSARDQDPLASVEALTLWEKSGGRSGLWRRRTDGAMEHTLEGEEGRPGDR